MYVETGPFSHWLFCWPSLAKRRLLRWWIWFLEWSLSSTCWMHTLGVCAGAVLARRLPEAWSIVLEQRPAQGRHMYCSVCIFKHSLPKCHAYAGQIQWQAIGQLQIWPGAKQTKIKCLHVNLFARHCFFQRNLNYWRPGMFFAAVLKLVLLGAERMPRVRSRFGLFAS